MPRRRYDGQLPAESAPQGRRCDRALDDDASGEGERAVMRWIVEPSNGSRPLGGR
jgi:hypothetical protein